MTVLTCNDLPREALTTLLRPYGLECKLVDPMEAIPGSFWGDSEAGLVENILYLRLDTPVHSALHEACHYICMDGQRRDTLHTDAGGGYDEENGVCYLQILLAGQLDEMGIMRMLTDMDTWGYSFRLGSARRWYEEDADDARQWLIGYGLIKPDNTPSWCLRR